MWTDLDRENSEEENVAGSILDDRHVYVLFFFLHPGQRGGMNEIELDLSKLHMVKTCFFLVDKGKKK